MAYEEKLIHNNHTLSFKIEQVKKQILEQKKCEKLRVKNLEKKRIKLKSEEDGEDKMKMKQLSNDIQMVKDSLNDVQTRNTRTNERREKVERKIQELQTELGLCNTELKQIEEEPIQTEMGEDESDYQSELLGESQLQ